MSIAEKLTTIAENQQRVYDAGKTKEWSDFWDAYQVNGTRTYYYVAFFSQSHQNGPYWTDDTFKPKYPIRPTNAQNMLTHSPISGDLREKAVIDFSNATIVTSAISYCPNLTHIGVLDLRKVNTSSINAVGNCSNLKTIDEIIYKDDGTQYGGTGGLSFAGCTALENVTITGVINFKVDASMCTKLTHDSLMSIINALQKLTSGTLTCTLGTANLAKLTDAEKAIATQKGWTLA